jgi:hypothetical protein
MGTDAVSNMLLIALASGARPGLHTMSGSFTPSRRSSSGKLLILPGPKTTRGVEAEKTNVSLLDAMDKRFAEGVIKE